MRLKSAYREKPVEAPNIPEEKIQPSESVKIDFGTDEAEHSVAIVSADEIPEPDEATLALQNQLAHLKKSEELQRQYAQHMAQQAQRQPSREEKLASWRAQGADKSELRFMEQNPGLIDHANITSQAASLAFTAGLQRGTDEFNNAVKANFDALMGRTEAQAQAQPAADSGRFFEPEPTRLPAPESVHDQRASIVSAPVSMREAGGYREPSPRQVRLTGEESAIAAASGISDVEYARHKLRLLRAKAAGEIQ